MRTAAVMVFWLAIAVPGIAQTSRVNAANEATVRRVVQQHEDARNRADWKAMADLFTEDAEQLTSAGEWRHGRAQIEKGVAESFAANYNGGTYTGRVDTVRLLDDNVAVVNGTFEIANIGGRGSRQGYTTFVVVRANNRWLIAVARWMVPTGVGALPAR
jgi:uncharacterized protein (TIGR02246 family)